MTAKKEYEVLSGAPFIAGLRSPGQFKNMTLSDEQARYPLIAGHIRPHQPDAAPDADTDAGSVKPATRKKG